MADDISNGLADNKASDLNKDGFRTGPNGGLFPDPAHLSTNHSDFESWDWVRIRTAVVGYASASSSVVSSGGFVQPSADSIRRASVVLNRARAALLYVGDNIRLQTEALAGENGAWKGPAADAFRSMNLLFAAKLHAKAEQINGGELAGPNNVPRQLWNSGNFLEWAQQNIIRLDNEYAKYIAVTGVTLNNGLAKIEGELAAQMTNAMRSVVRILADQYSYNTNSVTPPNPADFKVNPKPPGPGGGDGPGGGGPDLSKLSSALMGPPPSDDLPGGSGNKPPSLGVSPPPGAGGGSGVGALPKPPSLNVSPPPGGSGGGLGELPPPPSLGVSPPPGVGGGSGVGALPKPPSLDVSPPPGIGGALPPPSLSASRPPGAIGGGGAGGGSGAGGGIGVPNPPALSVKPPTGSGSDAPDGTTAPKPPSLDVSPPPGIGTGDDHRGAAAPPGMPMMPPPAGMGGQPGGAAAERPDSAGLLGGVGEPWGAGTAPLSGDPQGTNPPAVKPEDWAAGLPGGAPGVSAPPGMPMMPPPAGMGGQPGGAAAERPDSAGLLGGEKEPWEGAVPLALELSEASALPSVEPERWAAGGGEAAPAGAEVQAGLPAGGLTETAQPAAGPASPASPAGASLPAAPAQSMPGGGMPPMMPPGTGGQQNTAAERPDSAGLLGGLDKPWTVQENVRDISDAPAATPRSFAPESWAVSETAPVVMTVAADGLPVENEISPDAEVADSAGKPEEVVAEDVPAEGEDVVLAPPAAPAGWASFGGVPPVLGAQPPASGPTAPQAPVPASGSTTPGTNTSGTGPAGLDVPAGPRVADGEVAEDRDDERPIGASAPRGGADLLPAPDTVAVVRPDDSVLDTSAWDRGGLDFLLPGALMALAAGGSGRSRRNPEDQPVNGIADSSEPWEPESAVALTTYRRRKAGEGAAIAGTSEVLLSCGDEHSFPEDQREAYFAAGAESDELDQEDEEGDDDAEEERSAADLLNANDSAWSGTSASKPAGVLE